MESDVRGWTMSNPEVTAVLLGLTLLGPVACQSDGVDPFHGADDDTADRLYAAWHSAGEIDVYDFHSAEFIERVELDTWDQWVHGMAVRGETLHLLNRDATTAWIAHFDLDTGVLADEIVLEDLPYEGMVGGLWCP
jgi:hypothetical protein